MCWCLLIKIVTSKYVPQTSSCLFLAAFEKKAIALQTFIEQSAILATHNIPAQKSSSFLHEVREVIHSINMQMCDILF